MLEEALMLKAIIAAAGVVALVPAVILVTASPAAAIGADLAKKCRDMAIRAHPPPIPPGNKAYAQAERDYFRQCVSRNGQMPDNGAQQDPSNSGKH
jgi:hypothetical protein